jgi:hypothetical protein
MNTGTQLIDKLTNAISFKYKEDGTSPNLTISKLRHGYYCSVVRYTKNAKTKKNGKVVVVSAKGDTLELALNQIANNFLKTAPPERNPLQELADIMTDSSEKLEQVISHIDPFERPLEQVFTSR